MSDYKKTNDLTEKTTPVDADLLRLDDSADSFAWKKATIANVSSKIQADLMSNDAVTTIASTDTIPLLASGENKIISEANLSAQVQADIKAADNTFTGANNFPTMNVGTGNTASGDNATAEGNETVASGDNSHAEGGDTTASGNYAHAEGLSTTASAHYSHAEGNDTTASAYVSHAEGNDTTASGYVSHAEGNSTTASGYYSHAEGNSTTASSNGSHAEGNSTTASGYYSHAEGNSTTASATGSHAEGSSTTASGDDSHAEGNSTTASATGSHAEGSSTTASGDDSHAEGRSTTADNNYSHASGYYSTARLRSQHAQANGRFAATGDSQRTSSISHKETTDATPIECLTSTNERYVLPADFIMACTVTINGSNSDGTVAGFYKRQAYIKNIGGATALIGSVQTIGTDITVGSIGGISLTADDTNESLKIEVTGKASTTIRWVASIEAVEVGYGTGELPTGEGEEIIEIEETPPIVLDRTKVLVCESTLASDGHNATCKSIVEGIDDRLQVDVIESTFQYGVQYALDNGYAIISRSTTGLDDSDNPAGQKMLDNGGIAVHAHGSNGYYEEDNTYSVVDSIVAVRDVDGSYGTGSEFTLTEYTVESYVTPYMAGKMAKYALDNPSLSYTQIRLQLRADASNGGEVDPVTGYGTPDWDATETALSEM